MRTGNMDASWISLDDKEENIIGINLGADFTAEHEWGIKDIKQHFKIGQKEKDIGIKARKNNAVPKGLELVAGDKYVALIFRHISNFFDDRNSNFSKPLDEHVEEGYGFFHGESLPAWRIKDDEKGFVGAWDGKSFGVLALKKHEGRLRMLYEAFQKKDAMVGIGSTGGNPFSRGGLSIIVASKMPKDVIAEMEKKDKDDIQLLKDSEKTGIEKKLKKAGKGYFDSQGYMALSPSRPGEKDKKKTKYNVIYWLNPMAQQRHNYGWYTVEDLELWAKDEGPIMMNKEKA